MKKIHSTILALLCVTALAAQLRGNQQIETRSFPMSDIQTIKINFYTEVIIDAAAEEAYLEITTDGNLFDKIEKSNQDGILQLDQLEWIKPSIRGLVKIGAPNLEVVEQGTHEITVVKGLNRDTFRAFAKVGTIRLEGNVIDLRLMAEVGNIDATKVKTSKASVNVWGGGKAEIGTVNTLYADISNDGQLICASLPKDLKKKLRSGGQLKAKDEVAQLKNPSAKYIQFKIKNNSNHRYDFVVSGPKPEGGRFGYGFPLRAGQSRAETWTVGTKVYKTNSLGIRKLLVTIKAEDEGTTVPLFD